MPDCRGTSLHESPRLLLGLVLSFSILAKAKGGWVKFRAFLMLLPYSFAFILLYLPPLLSFVPNLDALVRLGMSFTDGVTHFSGEVTDIFGQTWLCSTITDFTVGFSRTKVKKLLDVQWVLDFVCAGIMYIFLWEMGFIASA
jgi:hypothetical protein